MARFRSAGRIASAAFLMLLCTTSCGTERTETNGFLFDTYTSFVISGADSAQTADSITGALTGLSDAFALCYTHDAADLPKNPVYGDCLRQVLDLSSQYGGGVDVTCGALTSLWGISDGTYHIPSDGEIADALATITGDGTFTDGTKLDFGAAAKGYACDEASRILAGSGADYAVIDLSSSTLLWGEKPDGAKFRAGITHPDGNGYLGIIETVAAYLSTSGGYERYFEADGQRFSHIMDIRTGRPAETDLVSVTVIVPAENVGGGILSDFLSTLITIEGTAQLDKWLAYEEFSVIAADENGILHSDFPGFLPDGDSGYRYE